MYINMPPLCSTTAYNYTKYSTWVPISHRFIVIVRSYFGSISSKSFPFVSGTHITTKNRPQHEMHAYNQNAPCNPSHSCNQSGKMELKKKKIIAKRQSIIIASLFSICHFEMKITIRVYRIIRTNLKVDKGFNAEKCTEITKARCNWTTNGTIFQRK